MEITTMFLRLPYVSQIAILKTHDVWYDKYSGQIANNMNAIIENLKETEVFNSFCEVTKKWYIKIYGE